MRLATFLFFLSVLAFRAKAVDLGHSLAMSPDFTEVIAGDLFVLDLRYASERNFMAKNVYGDFNRAFLHREAAGKLVVAAQTLRSAHPDYKLLILDALRPRSIQRVLWAHVKGKPEQRYVANPDAGSLHNYGFAVDLTVVDGQGLELDMGTPYDNFTELAQPRFEAKFLASGKLNPAQIANRNILRTAMTAAGFVQLPHEWWHYDALTRAAARKLHKIVE